MKTAMRTLNEDPRSQIGKYLMDNSLYRNPSSLERLGHNSKLGLGLTDHQKRLKPPKETQYQDDTKLNYKFAHRSDLKENRESEVGSISQTNQNEHTSINKNVMDIMY